MQSATGSIIFELKTLSGILRNYCESRLRKFDDGEQQTRMQHWIIDFLHSHEDEDICQKDVEKQFHITPSSTSGMLTLMEKKGYIERQRVDGDARLKKLVLTDKARQLHDQFQELRQKIDLPLESAITDEEKEELIRILHKIRAAALREMGNDRTEESN